MIARILVLFSLAASAVACEEKKIPKPPEPAPALADVAEAAVLTGFDPNAFAEAFLSVAAAARLDPARNETFEKEGQTITPLLDLPNGFEGKFWVREKNLEGKGDRCFLIVLEIPLNPPREIAGAPRRSVSAIATLFVQNPMIPKSFGLSFDFGIDEAAATERDPLFPRKDHAMGLFYAGFPGGDSSVQRRQRIRGWSPEPRPIVNETQLSEGIRQRWTQLVERIVAQRKPREK